MTYEDMMHMAAAFAAMDPNYQRPPRSVQQRNNLHTVARKYQEGTQHMGFMGSYDSDSPPELKLRQNIKKHNVDFARTLHKRGHKFDFDTGADDEKIHEWIRVVQKRYVDAAATPMSETSHDHDIVVDLFREQTESWEEIAREHLAVTHSDVTQFMESFITITYPYLGAKVVRYLFRPNYDTKMEDARQELAKIVAEERSGDSLATYDPSFMKGSTNRFLTMRYVKISQTSRMFDALIGGNSCQIEDETTRTELFDFLKVYYTAARARFIDCVCIQVVERHFLPNTSKGLVNIFSPAWVDGLSEAELEEISK